MLSTFLKPLAEFEKNIRTQIESATGLPLPMGLAETALNTAESIEAVIQSNFGTLPAIPPLPVPTGTIEMASSGNPVESTVGQIKEVAQEKEAEEAKTKEAEESITPQYYRLSFII